MIQGESITDVLGLFDFWTFTGVDIDPTNLYPIYNDVLHFDSEFKTPRVLHLTDVLRLVEEYNPPRYSDMIIFTDQFVAEGLISMEDNLIFDDIFDVGYYHASRVISDNLNLQSYFTYILVPICP